MRVIQWNIRSYFSNFEELKLLINDANAPDCICLQETRHGYGPTALHPPSRYVALQSQKNRDDESERGVAILLNRKINFHR